MIIIKLYERAVKPHFVVIVCMPRSEFPEIRNLHMFSAMDDTHFRMMMRASYVQNFPPQIELITEGEPSDFLHVVLSGSVDLFASWNRRETSIATVKPVSTFILAATIKDAPYLMSARTLEKSRIMLIPSQDVREIFSIDVNFARAIVSELADRYRATIKTTKDLKLRTSLERLANYLIRLHWSAGADEFELPSEKRHLAALLGMTPENLSRAIKNLQAYGVAIKGSHVVINNPADLERLAKPSVLIDDDTT